MESQCGSAVLGWLKNSERRDAAQNFDRLVQKFGVELLQAFRDRGHKYQHGIIHSLAKRGNADLIRHLVTQHGFDINVQRTGDQSTVLHLACFSDNRELEQVLRELGADTTLRNSYGETADGTKAAPKPPSALICGASTWQDVLRVVQEHGARFVDLDFITAYEWVGKKVAGFEEDRRWAPSGASWPEVQRDPRFEALAASCERLAGRWPPAERASCVTALLNALLKLPNDRIAKASLDAALSQPHAFEGWSSDVLNVWAWLLGKLGTDLELRRRCFRHTVESLTQAVPSLDKNGVCRLFWASAILNESDAGLLKALCEHLERQVGNEAFRNATLLSISTWALAKLGPSEAWPWQRALERLAAATVDDIESFTDQNVANTLWGHARLRFQDEALFRACFRRASVTIYQPCPQKASHLAQDYYAYQYCTVAMPGALEGLSERLRTDMQLITHYRQEGSMERLSQASSIVSARELRELDEMIDGLDRGEDVGGAEVAE